MWAQAAPATVPLSVCNPSSSADPGRPCSAQELSSQTSPECPESKGADGTTVLISAWKMNLRFNNFIEMSGCEFISEPLHSQAAPLLSETSQVVLLS